MLIRSYTDHLSYYDDWQDAVTRHPGFDVTVRNIAAEDQLPTIAREIEAAPFILLLHSTNADGCALLRRLMPAFQARRGHLAVFVGNEVNLPLAPMAEKFAFLADARADLILTQFLQETGEWYYQPLEGATVCSIPHALNPVAYQPGPPLSARPIQIGVRSFRYGPYIGDTERVDVHRLFQRLGEEQRLVTDIRIGDGRFNRKDWAAFLARCRGTISTEAGSAWLDRDDVLMHATQDRLKALTQGQIVLNQDGLARRMARLLLPSVLKRAIIRALGGRLVEDYNLGDHADEATIRAIQADLFTADRRAPYHTKGISSRHFDAIGSGTVQILVEGRYNDILVPNQHYIVLNRDFSNIEDVLVRFNDISACQRMVNDVREYALSSHTHSHRMARLEESLRSI
ncbi:CgeB family protein [Magnetospirillum molischianum]|uniref:glycosyltransferase n=1 Tax=Magnetospirillum molischianum TaxID=1083 RepID=UPI0012DEEB41|nr:glycosyltransferase [Magnetospirillum molischianum]